MARNHLAQERETVHLRHHQIRNHHVGAVAVERQERFLAVGRHLHLVALALQRGRQDLPEALFIVDDEDAVCHVRLRATTEEGTLQSDVAEVEAG